MFFVDIVCFAFGLKASQKDLQIHQLLVAEKPSFWQVLVRHGLLRLKWMAACVCFGTTLARHGERLGFYI